MRRIILFLSILCTSFFGISQDSTSKWDINKIVYNLRKNTNSLNLKYNGSNTQNITDSCAAKIFELKTIMDDSYSKFLKVPNSDSMFRQSLLINYRALQNENINLKIIEDLIDDFNSKKTSFDLGLDENETQYIPVEVTTYDSSLHKASGYYVYWNFWLDKDNPNPYSKFNEFTNPTSSGFLIPGVYDIWVVRASDNKRFPSLIYRTKNVIFLKSSEKTIPVTIIIR